MPTRLASKTKDVANSTIANTGCTYMYYAGTTTLWAFKKIHTVLVRLGIKRYKKGIAISSLPACTCLICTAIGTLLVGGRKECAHSAELVPHETQQCHPRTLSMNILMSSGGHFGISG